MNGRSMTGVFMNFEAPSQCSGTVTSWRYCHYGSTDNDEYIAKLGIYRRNSNTMSYELVGSLTTVLLNRAAAENSACREAPVDREFQIQENDVIGACLGGRTSGQRNQGPLLLISDNAPTDERLYTVSSNGANFDGCRDNQLQTIDMSNTFTRENQWRLHLSANTSMLI